LVAEWVCASHRMGFNFARRMGGRSVGGFAKVDNGFWVDLILTEGSIGLSSRGWARRKTREEYRFMKLKK
jgi:hypothetical protein